MPPLTGGESLERPGGNERRPRPRIESLADLIFGLSLAIDSIALLPTSATKPGDMNSRILIFAFAFPLPDYGVADLHHVHVRPADGFLDGDVPERGPPAPRRADSVLAQQRGARRQSGNQGLFLRPVCPRPLGHPADPRLLRAHYQRRREPHGRTGPREALSERPEPDGGPRRLDGDFVRASVRAVDPPERPSEDPPMDRPTHLVLAGQGAPTAEADIQVVLNARRKTLNFAGAASTAHT